MSSIQQAQAEGICLHYPENLGTHVNIALDNAVSMLLRAVSMAQTVAFQWRYIDKPGEGQLALIFLPTQVQFPNDGIRYQEPEITYSMNAGPNRELEVSEAKSGFIPGSQDQNAWRVRRRYRLLRGGHPALVLVHYTRGSPAPINPALLSQPMRAYPLRLVTEPATYVLGDKQGQKVFAPGAPPMQPPPPTGGFNHAAQAALMNQNNSMEQLERRREREREKERARDRSASHGAPVGRPHIDDHSDDETDQIATRTLALARYKRNHDIMSEVFSQAAFGDKSEQTHKSPYSIFNKEDLETRSSRLQEEIESLQQKAAQRKIAREQGQNGSGLEDVSMQPISA